MFKDDLDSDLEVARPLGNVSECCRHDVWYIMHTFKKVCVQNDLAPLGPMQVSLYNGEVVELLEAALDKEGALRYVDDGLRIGSFSADEWARVEQIKEDSIVVFADAMARVEPGD